MNKLLTILAAVFVAFSATALAPQMLSENHAMLRVDATGKYLLLPVQEKEENAYVRVIVNNSATTLFTSCDDFLDEHKPQATLSDEQVKSPENAEAMAISAYAIFTSAEDINSSFSMWNFDVRSDDAYKGGNGTSDGDVFHQLEVQQGVLTTNWNINDMWVRLYNSLSRVNSAIPRRMPVYC